MATFVLVHGSFQASWCWREVVPRLERRGHRAVTLDLPAHGADRTPIEKVTMNGYVSAIVRAVRATGGSPILVGHSMGNPIAGAAVEAPDLIAALVFVAGLLPPMGLSLMQMVAEFDPAYLSHAVWAPDRLSVGIAPAGVREFVYSDVPAALVDEVIPLFTNEPIGPYETPFTGMTDQFEQVPRCYVETLRDRVVLPAIQKNVQSRMAFNRVLSIDTGHAPFFSTPDALVSCLDSVAAEFGS